MSRLIFFGLRSTRSMARLHSSSAGVMTKFGSHVAAIWAGCWYFVLTFARTSAARSRASMAARWASGQFFVCSKMSDALAESNRPSLKMSGSGVGVGTSTLWSGSWV